MISENKELPLLCYPAPDGVTAFSTTREGGVSRGPFASMNINEYCGDDPEDVAANKALLAKRLGIPADAIIMPHQTHQTRVAVIDEQTCALDEPQRRRQLEGIDALVTDRPDICIGVSTADCIPILFWDRHHHVVAAAHAGWRGTVAGIVDSVIETLKSRFKTDPSALWAAIGPGISQDAFEVGDEVYEAFSKARFDISRISTSINGRWHIDLLAANTERMLAHGLSIDNICCPGICTYTHHNQFFSARRLGIQSGRIFTGIMWHPEALPSSHHVSSIQTQ